MCIQKPILTKTRPGVAQGASLAGLLMLVLAAPWLQAQDEPIVIEDLSRAELSDEIEKVENEFFRVFNANVEDDRLHVECSTYTPTGSHIPQRACEPQFLINARNRNVQDWQNNVDDLKTSQTLTAELQAEFGELTAAMNVVMAENQYFRELNAVLRMLRERMAELDA